MPFFVGYTQTPRIIRLNSEGAGEDQYVLCPPAFIYLEATLNDSTNLRNNVFLWEQINGPPVELSSTTDLAINYPYDGNQDDKTFRFSIDKGTAREQYDDITVYYTPTSFFPKRLSRGIHTEVSQTIPNLIKEASFIFPPLDGLHNDNVIAAPGTKFIFDKTTVPGLAGNQAYSEVLTDANFVRDPTDLYQTYQGLNYQYIHPEYLIVPNGVYVFRVYYNLPLQHRHNPVAFDSTLLVGQQPARDDYKIINDVQAFSERSKISVTRVLVKLESVPEEYPLTVIGRGVPTNIRYNPMAIFPEDKSELEHVYSLIVLDSGFTDNIIRLDPSNIGSGT